MPSCMVNSADTVVDWPGFKVVEPTTARGGQQPSTVSTAGLAAIVNGASPTFRS